MLIHGQFRYFPALFPQVRMVKNAVKNIYRTTGSKENKIIFKIILRAKNPDSQKMPDLKLVYGQFCYFLVQDSYENHRKLFKEQSGSKETENIF